MCGIAGIYTPRDATVPDAGLLTRMTRTLEHRGPDAEGYYQGPGIGLGHRRLSIIDVARGVQPMHSADGSLIIVFNGEIYNYRSLREELRALGRSFSTDSDTEVILEAYAVFGERCVDRLRGMFAFALWDASRRRLFLARDRIGIKPLYYAWAPHRFLFGSELKAILSAPGLSRELDVRALDEYLSFLYVPAPRSILSSVRKLRPGHTLTVSEAGIEEREYWDLRFEPDEARSEVEHATGLLETLREAVSLHLMSEVPLGAFLSGGLDSSAVVGIMSGVGKGPVTTASIGFDDDAYDELAYARMVASRFGTSAHEKTVRADAAGLLDRLAWNFDEPFADSSMIPTYQVSAVAREHVTVCLSGDGGDENFAGYRRYRFDLLENRVRSLLPARARRALLGPLAHLYPKADWLPRYLRAKTLLTNLTLSPERGYFHTMTWFGPDAKGALYRPWLADALGDHDAYSVMEPWFERSRGWHPLSRIQYVDIKTYLPDDILTKVDRASMAHSLEVRVPLLDHVVMEYAARIPAGLKLRGGAGKHIFKAALKGLVPREIMDRPKMGFSVPLARWFRRELGPMFEQTVLAPDAYVGRLFRPEAVQGLYREHRSGLRDHAYKLWVLLALEFWGRRFAGTPGE